MGLVSGIAGLLPAWLDILSCIQLLCADSVTFDGASPVFGERIANTTTASWQNNSSVAQIEDGFVIVWQSGDSFGNDNSGYSIQAQAFASDGSFLGGEIQVNTYTTDNQGGSSVAIKRYQNQKTAAGWLGKIFRLSVI